MSKVEKAINFMEQIANDNSHGYDQIYRWGQTGDYDCSSLVITAWERAGVPVKSNGATYTGNMYSVFTALGFTDVTGKINLAYGTGLQRGDVLLNHVNHVAMYCGNGLEVEASINEFGGATGGQPGDQTGAEILIRPYRNYPWDCVLRFYEDVPAEKTKASASVASVGSGEVAYTFDTEEIKAGSQGLCVLLLQEILKARGYYDGGLDRSFGKKTKAAVWEYQKDRKMSLNGICGNALWQDLLALPRGNGGFEVEQLCAGDKGNDVLLLQEILKSRGYYKGGLDRSFGAKTLAAVKEYQKDRKMKTDGICGTKTWRDLIAI